MFQAPWGTRQVQGLWNQEQRELTSNQKELKGIVNAYFAFKGFIPRGADIMIRSDNTTAIAYVKGKGKIPELMQIIQPMIKSMLKRRLNIRCTHIPGIENTEADDLSRKFPKLDHDWTLSDEAYQTIVNRWGPMAFDMFASWQNSKLPQYAAWGPDPSSAVTDVLSQPWKNLPFPWYLVPPWPMIPRVVAKLRQEFERGTPFQSVLVVPFWKGASWYPCLLNMNIEVMALPPRAIVPGPSGYHPMKDRSDQQMVAIKISSRA